MADQKEAHIEPFGLVQFQTDSLSPTVSELEGTVRTHSDTEDQKKQQFKMRIIKRKQM